MHPHHLEYDAAALERSLIQKHGSDLGKMVFASESTRRQRENSQCADLQEELKALESRISAMSTAANVALQPLTAERDRHYATYIASCEQVAVSDMDSQSKMSPLRNRTIDIQQLMRAVTCCRSAERELRELSAVESTDAILLARVEKKLPPEAARPLTDLEKINFGIYSK